VAKGALKVGKEASHTNWRPHRPWTTLLLVIPGKQSIRSHRARRWLFTLITLGLTATVLELGSKLFARKYLLYSRPAFGNVLMDHAVLHHVWIPSRLTTINDRGVPYTVITNSQGWNETYDVSREKPADIFRVFYVGDSNTQGVVMPEHKMVELVENGLNAEYQGKPAHFEVINTGTSSYSFVLYHLLIKTVLLDYSPDLIVLNIDMSDVANDAGYRPYAVRDSAHEIVAVPPAMAPRYIMTAEGTARICNTFALPHWLTDHSDFLFLLDTTFRNARIKLSLRDLDRRANWLALEWPPETVASINESMATRVSTLRLLKSHGVRAMVASVPHYEQFTGRQSPRPHQVLREVVEREGVPFLDSYAALKPKIVGSQVTGYYWKTDSTHFNIAGNRIWADAQLAFLLDPRNGLLPPLPGGGDQH